MSSLLLDLGEADPDDGQQTALFIAAQFSLEVLKILVDEGGAEVDRRVQTPSGDDRRTALLHAASLNRLSGEFFAKKKLSAFCKSGRFNQKKKKVCKQ